MKQICSLLILLALPAFFYPLRAYADQENRVVSKVKNVLQPLRTGHFQQPATGYFSAGRNKALHKTTLRAHAHRAEPDDQGWNENIISLILAGLSILFVYTPFFIGGWAGLILLLGIPLAAIVFGILGLVHKHRFPWAGIIGMILGAAVLGLWIWAIILLT